VRALPRLAGPVPRVLRAALLAAALAAVGIFHVWTHTRVVAAGYALARLEAENRRLAAERSRLELEVSTLRAPGRLERWARARLGMAPPAPGAVVAVGKGGGGSVGAMVGAGSGRAGPAEPASSRVQVALGAAPGR
jgi:cell division protein FtsL